MLAAYPDRIQPLGWAVFGAFLAVGFAIAATWLFLRRTGSRPSRDRTLRIAHRAGTILFAQFFWLVLLNVLAVFVQGGSAINTERIRQPGQYLLQGKNGVWEVSQAEFVISWVLGYGCTVGAIFAGLYGAWLKWYPEAPARREETAERSSAADRAPQ